MQNTAKKYNNTKLTISIAKSIITFILMILIVQTGVSSSLEKFTDEYISGSYLQFMVYVLLLGAGFSVLFMPVNWYTGYYLEHKYNLSNQTMMKYIIENLKGLAVSLLIGAPVLLFFWYALLTYESYWWLPFAIFIFLLSVVLARIVPIVILPLFYKVEPLENDTLKERIKSMAIDAGLKVENVYSFDMSKNTKKANAAFTGLGKAKRIILGDTLLESFNEDEIETVIAHELGHYKKKHITKNILIGTISSFATLWLIALLYDMSLSWFDFDHRTTLAALPLLSVWSMLLGVIQSPLSSYLSRKFEYEADEYAVSVTGKPLVFTEALDKLTEQNLGDREPHPFVEWMFYSHPSIKNRVAAIKKLIPEAFK